MAAAIVNFSVSLAGGILCCLIAFVSKFMFSYITTPKAYVLMIFAMVVMSSYFIGVLLTMIGYFTSPNKSKISVGQIFVKALMLPAMNAAMMFVFAVVPVLFGILPPAFQRFPGEGMSFIGAFRGIPESMVNIVGPEALPAAEMFYAFWGGIYGTSLAMAGF
jgi:hypothetical protein